MSYNVHLDFSGDVRALSDSSVDETDFHGRTKAYSVKTDRGKQFRPSVMPLLTTLNPESQLLSLTRPAPMTTRNAPGSKVSKTEAKLILALRRELTIAKSLIEKDKSQKAKLVEIARTLRVECLRLSSGAGGAVVLKVSDEC